MDKELRIAEALERLFRTYQQSGQGDAAEVAQERLERAQVYFEAVSDYEIGDIEAAVRSFIAGKAPGHNPSFIPPAPVVAAETRRQLNLRLDSQQRSQLARPALPRPDVEHTPESRARIKAMVDAVASKASLPDAIRDKSSKARGEADTRWLLNRGDLVEHPGNPYPVSRTLLRQFEVGDAEGEQDAA